MVVTVFLELMKVSCAVTYCYTMVKNYVSLPVDGTFTDPWPVGQINLFPVHCVMVELAMIVIDIWKDAHDTSIVFFTV